MDTVLVVDDSSFIVEGLIAFLKKKYRTLAAYGGAECLEMLKREIPSVIILDIMMEPMDGWETLSRIKENPQTRDIPVLMFSAKKISPEEAEEHRIRIDDFIIKPVSPKKIIEAIDKVLARRDTSREIVGRWRSAGISQEKIDEYLSLVTGLEVDLSLCQNMKIQCDLASPRDDNREFRDLIDAIEARIVQERGLIDALAREMDEAAKLATPGAGSTGTGVSGDAVIAADIAESAGTAADNQPSPSPAGSLAESSPPGPAGPVEEGAGVTGPGPAAAGQPEPGIPGMEHGTGAPSSAAPGVLPPVPAPSGAAPSEPAVTPAAEVTGSPGPGYRTGAPETDREGMPGKETEPPQPVLPLPGTPSPVQPVHEPEDGRERKIIPADPDILPAAKGTDSPTGAGTDGPMPWDSLRSRNQHRSILGLAAKSGMSPAGTGQPGIFRRIFTFIRSIFGKT